MRQPVDQAARMNMTNSMKKSTMYRKLFNSSSDYYTITEEMARYRQKFESAARKGTKEISSIVFREFWEEEQKRKFNERVEKKGNGVKLRVERAKNRSEKGSEGRSFEGFL
jgi:hypothetical protein